jgi:hypothetical protein
MHLSKVRKTKVKKILIWMGKFWNMVNPLEKEKKNNDKKN